jgi:hypothetical protein
MNIDLYTKTVLTVIAACLVYLCLGRPAVMSPIEAQAPPNRVIIAGIEHDAIQRLYADPLPVVVKAEPASRRP